MSAALPSDVTSLLGILMDVMEKTQDPDNPPNEGDYLKSMNVLKALNDRKDRFGAAQVRIVEMWRERIRERADVRMERLFTQFLPWATKKQEGWKSCPACGTLCAGEYAVSRHMKRATCYENVVRIYFYSEGVQKRVAAWWGRGYQGIDLAFYQSMAKIHAAAKLQVVRLGDARHDIPHDRRLLPRRIIPVKLWESMWSAGAQQLDPNRALVYHPDMFCGRMRNTKLWGGQSLCYQGKFFNIPSVTCQERWFAEGRRERQFVHVHETGLQIFVMYIAPDKQPHYTYGAQLANAMKCAGAFPAI